MKAVLEISGFDVDTATSAREGKLRIKKNEYEMIITDMRMESDASGREVIQAARTAPYHPAVALLTAYPLAEEDWQDMGADKMLVKPMQTAQLIKQLEKLLENHAAKLSRISFAAAGNGKASAPRKSTHTTNAPGSASGAGKASATRKASAKKSAARKVATKSSSRGRSAGNSATA